MSKSGPNIKDIQPISRFREILEEKQNPRANKFNAQPTTLNGILHDSKSEASGAGKLLQLQERGYISGLRLDKVQLKYPMMVNDTLVCTYEADAAFMVLKQFEMPTKTGAVVLREGERHVVDFKGVATDVYRIKRNLMLALYGIKILEI